MSSIKIEFRDGATIEFGVMRLPNRKNPALFKTIHNEGRVLGYFKDEFAAIEFEQTLDMMIKRLGKK